jgi:hypothetical protein
VINCDGNSSDDDGDDINTWLQWCWCELVMVMKLW